MQVSMNLVLAIYGAILSTGLALLTAIKFLRERPRISVECIPLCRTAREGSETHGVLVRVLHGDDVLWEEADVEIRVCNAGTQACQVTDVFVETATEVQKIRPNGLPVILEPRTSCSVYVQPEYFVPKTPTESEGLIDIPVEAVGVYDALAKKHRISRGNLATLVRWCAELPVRTSLFRHKDTGNVVVAFKAKDPATIVRKTRRDG
jgi:hypothetical protein